MIPGLGLLPPDGRHDTAMAVLERPMCAATDAEIPDEVDPVDTLCVNDQGPFNSCCGNAVDKALERDHHISTGEIINLSARFSYCAARMIDGTNDGPDQGAQIEGGARGASEIGCVTEETLPYWPFDQNAFDPEIPQPVLNQAGQHKARAIARMRSIEEAIRFLGSGQGALIFGIWWTTGLQNFSGGGPITRDPGGRVVGGHALCLPAYKTISGYRWPKPWNSHSRRWGDNGTMTVEPDLLWRWVQAAPWGMYGISGL